MKNEEQVKKNSLDICREKAFRFLEIRQHSVFELKNKLLRTCERKDINNVLTYLLEINYLNDYNFSKNYLEWKVNTHGLYKISMDLRKRGISQEIIQETITNYQNEHLEENTSQIIQALAIQKWRTIRDKSDLNKAKMKVARFLAQRGFTSDQIWSSIHQLENE